MLELGGVPMALLMRVSLRTNTKELHGLRNNKFALDLDSLIHVVVVCIRIVLELSTLAEVA